MSLSLSLEGNSEHKMKGSRTLVLEVRDTGSGIPDHWIQRLASQQLWSVPWQASLEPLARDPSVTNAEARGLGFGLLTVTAHVKALQGTISAARHFEPHGSIVSVRIPYVTAESACSQHIVAKLPDLVVSTPSHDKGYVQVWMEDGSGGVSFRWGDLPEEQDALAVLLIEDDHRCVGVIKQMLQVKGFVVHEAADGEAGLCMMKRRQYDLVLADVVMPVMDGVQCVKQYRRWTTQHSIPFHQYICGLTAQGNEKMFKDCLDSGMDEVLSKPIQNTQLIEVLSRIRGRSPPAHVCMTNC